MQRYECRRKVGLCQIDIATGRHVARVKSFRDSGNLAALAHDLCAAPQTRALSPETKATAVGKGIDKA
jgi:hypothetical protein